MRPGRSSPQLPPAEPAGAGACDKPSGGKARVMVKAVRLHDHDSPPQVDDVDLAEPARDEVRVELAFAGVNPVDTYVARGQVAAEGPLPRILGGEASGHVSGRPVL